MNKETAIVLHVNILLLLLLVQLLGLNLPTYLSIISLLLVILLPGYLILEIIGHKLKSWAVVYYSLGIGVATLMFMGLLLNYILYALGTKQPLVQKNIIIVSSLLLLLLTIVHYKTRRRIHDKIIIPGLNFHERILIIFGSLILMVSVLATLILNYSGSNTLTIVSFISITIIILFTFISRDNVKAGTIVFVILMVSMSLLLMLSLRSDYISGYDISIEYRIFTLTSQNHFWDYNNFVHAYNACLSINIFPTIIQNLTSFSDVLIFKLVYPLIFAFFPVIVYNLINKQLSKEVAFLTSIFIISHSWFIDPMTTLARQEIGMLFFALTILVLFDKDLNNKQRNIVLIIFGFSMVVSHYTTSYIALAILVGAWLFNLMINMISGKIPTRWRILKTYRENLSGTINLILLISIIAFAIIWYTQVTQISGNFVHVVRESISNLDLIASSDTKSVTIFHILTNAPGLNINEVYNNYFENTTQSLKKTYSITPYPTNTYSDYELTPFSSYVIHGVNQTLTQIIMITYRLIVPLVEILYLFGFIYLMYLLISRRNNIYIYSEYIVIGLIALLFIALMFILPYLSGEYYIERLYIQGLTLFAYFNILGGKLLLKLFHIKDKLIVLLVIYLVFLLFNYGVLWQIAGTSRPTVWLNNGGYYYDITYTHKSEVISATWLSNNYDHQSLVYTSGPGKNRIWAYGFGINKILQDVVPNMVDRSSYVYLTYANQVDKMGFFSYRGTILSYNYPYDFINNNKNELYDNGGSSIYR